MAATVILRNFSSFPFVEFRRVTASHVRVSIPGICETLIAYLAWISFLAGMRAFVDIAIRTTIEDFLAKSTGIFELLALFVHVAQMTFVVVNQECFATNFAIDFAVAVMRPFYVDFQFVFCAVNFATIVALEAIGAV